MLLAHGGRLRACGSTRAHAAPAAAPPAAPWPPQLLLLRRRRAAPRAPAAAVPASRAGDAGERVRRSRRERSGGEADGADDDLLLDPREAARLRRLIKAKGMQAVVDASGIVKVPTSDAGDGAAAAGGGGGGGGGGSGSGSGSGGSGGRSSNGAAAEQSEPAAAQQRGGPLERGGGADGQADGGRGRLFARSQLQAATPGSGGAAPALPIVRPAGGDARGGEDGGRARGAPGSGSSAAFFSAASWAELGAAPEVVEALAALGITRPSHVQAEAFRALARKGGVRHVALADQAGSGKTLAYLLPLLQQLKQREAAAGAPVTQPHSPSIVVMTPTAELAQQVGRVVRALSGAGLRVRGAVMTGGQSEADRRNKTFRTQCELLAGGVDVLVSTPGRLIAHLDRGSLSLEHTAALVMDEVDVLAGGEVSYAEHVAPLRAASGPGLRCVLVSATLPQHTFDELQELFMGLGAAFGPGLHRTATGCVEELVDCSGGDDVSLESGTQRKLDALGAALARVRSPRVMVFCNKIETCRVVENALKRRGPDECQVLAYHEAIRDEARSAALAAWLAPPARGAAPLVLVCTDRTSRGIDSMWCEHVVLFEFPRDPSEYVRRVGRTARGAGGRGVVTVLVLGKQVALAKDILARNRAGAPVHRVPRLWADGGERGAARTGAASNRG
ncbi:DEAD-box ATP-dependent RNA helicase 50 [Scenedesmus sp. PABB004]|nr:DEAD-box ATP-dependent RNA helicase 50 [Scenedesmus sp. PABB004]